MLNAFQDYVPSRTDCPGYDIPLEKTPRQINSGLDSDNYYPSGERRPSNGEMRQIIDYVNEILVTGSQLFGFVFRNGTFYQNFGSMFYILT